MIREAARIYATTKPAALHRRVAIEHNINSTQTCRALAIMIALTGNLDIKGGNVFRTRPKGYVGRDVLLGIGKEGRAFRLGSEIEEKRIGSNAYPLISGPRAIRRQFVNALLFIDTVLTGKPYPVKALFCGGANPTISIQNSKKVWEALKKLELLVVIDLFMTPTAELADYVLPAAMWPERDGICDMMYVNYIGARQKAIEPLYECWHDMKISIELVKRIPWADRNFIPWDSVEEFHEWRVKGLGITFEELKERSYIMEPMKYKKYKQEFKTPTGKVELYSTIFEKYGYDPLPTYLEPPESPFSTPDLLDEYPFILITGSRYINYYHSQGRQIPSLRKLAPDPEVEIHPDTASRLNINDGDWVWIETPQVKGERVKFKAKLTTDIHPMIIHARHGWWFPEKPTPEHCCFESNINVVTTGAPPREKICGSVSDRGTLCKVYRVK